MSKNAQKWIKFDKFMMQKKYTGVWFSIAFCVPFLSLAQKTLNKSWDKSFLKMWSQNLEKEFLIWH